MKQDFSEIMSGHTDDQLIEIVKIKREDYQEEAVKAAEIELQKRGLEVSQINLIEEVLQDDLKHKSQLEATKVSAWTRLLHFCIDLLIYIIILFLFGLILELFKVNLSQENGTKLGYFLLVSLFYAYYVFMEYRYQKTIAKFLTRTKVVMEDGRKPELKDILLRTTCRFIPFDRFSYFFSNLGLHDKFSNTKVLKDSMD
tara:strand:+ start:561 stop:1157 length:597 start_codon:yes stop_codon:yes gene_type:complete